MVVAEEEHFVCQVEEEEGEEGDGVEDGDDAAEGHGDHEGSYEVGVPLADGVDLV